MSHEVHAYKCPDHNTYKFTWSTCADRTCQPCAGKRRARLLDEYRDIAGSIKSPWFITFTLRRGLLTVAGVKKIRHAFRTLYKAFGWSGLYQIELGTVRREAASCAVTSNVHIHALIEGYDISAPGQSWSELCSVWYQLTGSYVIDIEKVWRSEKAVDYLAKHMLKRPHKGDWDTYTIGIINDVLRGARLVHQFGRLHGVARPAVAPVRPLCPVCGREMEHISLNNCRFSAELATLIARLEGLKPPNYGAKG